MNFFLMRRGLRSDPVQQVLPAWGSHAHGTCAREDSAQVCCEGRTWRLFLRFVCLFVFKVLWSDSSVTSVTKSPSEVTEFISKVRWFRAPLETPKAV